MPGAEKKDPKKTDDGNYEKEIISKFPNLEVAQMRYLVNHPELDAATRTATLEKLMAEIKTNDMAPYYKLLAEELKMPFDKALYDQMKANNNQKLDAFDAEIADAEKNQGESEVRAALLKKYDYFCQIGDKDNALKASQSTFEKTVGTGYKIDLVFNIVRLGLFFLDHQMINNNLTRARELMEQGGDWERKNRLRSYEALYKMSVRDFSGAAALFLEAVPTFGSYELFTYEQLTFYAVVTSLYALDRPDLRTKVIKSNEIQEQLSGDKVELHIIREYLTSYYECNYEKFFQNLAELESTRLKFDRYFHSHFNYYSRVMRLRAYLQFLTPYKTVRLDLMARDFGVSTEFLDKELHRLVAAGQLPCRIDAVQGVIHMHHPDSKDRLFKSVIKDGDILLNRVQKLARVINA
ncbi:unnamed protein product, partial [Mesorhabditis spiculigera]